MKETYRRFYRKNEYETYEFYGTRMFKKMEELDELFSDICARNKSEFEFEDLYDLNKIVMEIEDLDLTMIEKEFIIDLFNLSFSKYKEVKL